MLYEVEWFPWFCKRLLLYCNWQHMWDQWPRKHSFINIIFSIWQGNSFVQWVLGGLKDKLHRLWTVLRAYVFIASCISPGCFGLDLPLWVSRLAVFVNQSLGGEGHESHRLWTGLLAYVFMASRISKCTFCWCAPLGFQVRRWVL